MQLRLCPVRRLEIEDDDIGEVLAVFILSAKDQQLGALPETCRVA
jgi:hypothetical protein